MDRLLVFASCIAAVAAQVTYQDASSTVLRVDNGTYGPPVEEVH